MTRVRFAPSPTGFLHVGGARTALFNWLFARHHQGTFILRIEDTDEARSTNESVGQILESMQWLGLNWDEGPVVEASGLKAKGNFGPYFQTERTGIYKKYAEELKSKNVLYECFCSEEELESQRKRAMLEKRPPRYPKRCRALTDPQKQEFRVQGRKPVLRFAVPEGTEVAFDDEIRQRVLFKSQELEDFVVIKSSGGPTYNFACVIDDHLMEITHVIRGEDHISNTPKQILLYQAFGWTPPKFAHLSIILGPDGTRLSKRHGATGVMEFDKEGYLPQALVNYLALLGWGTETSQDLFEPQELIEKFDLARCQKNPAAFDYGKLSWMNGIYIRKLTKEQLFEAVARLLPQNSYPKDKLREIVALEQEKYKTLADVPAALDFFFTEEYPYKWEDLEGLFAKSKSLKGAAECSRLLAALIERLKRFSAGESPLNPVVERGPASTRGEPSGLVLGSGGKGDSPALNPYERLGRASDFSASGIEALLKEIAKEFGWKNGEVYHPLRFAVSGRLQGPSLFHMVEALGPERVAARIKRLQGSLKEAPLK